MSWLRSILVVGLGAVAADALVSVAAAVTYVVVCWGGVESYVDCGPFEGPRWSLTVADAVKAYLPPGGPISRPSAAAVLVGGQAAGLLAFALGGFLAAMLAPRRPIYHAVLVAPVAVGVRLLEAARSGRLPAARSAQPWDAEWAAWIVLIAAIAGLGGLLRGRIAGRRAQSGSAS